MMESVNVKQDTWVPIALLNFVQTPVPIMAIASITNVSVNPDSKGSTAHFPIVLITVKRGVSVSAELATVNPDSLDKTAVFGCVKIIVTIMANARTESAYVILGTKVNFANSNIAMIIVHLMGIVKVANAFVIKDGTEPLAKRLYAPMTALVMVSV
jgi:hypothetical protein